jgi:hypothetical protein
MDEEKKREADGWAEKRGIMSWRCTKTRWKIDRTRLPSHISL